MMNPQWQISHAAPELLTKTLHIWKVELNQPHANRERLFALLSDVEKARALRFQFPLHRERYIISQGGLRIILSRYLSIEPQDIHFSQGAYGKPYITSAKNIFFNLSNSHDLALYAVLLDEEVGIDLEYYRDKVSYADLTERFFSTDEKRYFSKLPAAQQKEAFFRLWTGKEAFLKAIGEGLSFPLDAFSVDVENEKLISIRGDSALANMWHVRLFTPAENYVAAVVYAEKMEKFSFFQLTF